MIEQNYKIQQWSHSCKLPVKATQDVQRMPVSTLEANESSNALPYAQRIADFIYFAGICQSQNRSAFNRGSKPITTRTGMKPLQLSDFTAETAWHFGRTFITLPCQEVIGLLAAWSAKQLLVGKNKWEHHPLYFTKHFTKKWKMITRQRIDLDGLNRWIFPQHKWQVSVGHSNFFPAVDF